VEYLKGIARTLEKELDAVKEGSIIWKGLRIEFQDNKLIT